MLLRDKRDRASAEAFFRRAFTRRRVSLPRTLHTRQRFLESFEGLHALGRGYIKLHELVPSYRPRRASVQEMSRAVVTTLNVLGARLKKAA